MATIPSAGYRRSGVAAAGALIGAVVAVPVAAFLIPFLMEQVAAPIVREMGSSAGGGSGFESALGGLVGVIIGVMLAAVVVFSLVAPILVLLPVGITAASLRMVKAGLILRTLWLGMAACVVLGVIAARLASALGAPTGWAWLLMVPVGAFLARFVVEACWPDRAALPDVMTLTVGWRRAGVGLIGAMVLSLVVVVVFFMFAKVSVAPSAP